VSKQAKVVRCSVGCVIHGVMEQPPKKWQRAHPKVMDCSVGCVIHGVMEQASKSGSRRTFF
jgi:hypothetical protein